MWQYGSGCPESVSFHPELKSYGEGVGGGVWSSAALPFGCRRGADGERPVSAGACGKNLDRAVDAAKGSGADQTDFVGRSKSFVGFRRIASGAAGSDSAFSEGAPGNYFSVSGVSGPGGGAAV